MIEPDKRKAVFLMHQEGMSAREIARCLGVSRNTVREIVRQGGTMPAVVREKKVQIDPELLKRLNGECDGWKQRIHEKLVEEAGIEIQYSTLTRLLREQGIGHTRKARCDRVPDTPGAEMQHDTTTYKVKLGGKPTRIVASLMYLRYSKRRYLKFYLRFNRFSMKCFFHETLTFWNYAAPICVIDNTNLARLRGTGKDAVMVPEMEAFGKQYGFEFLCHAIGHANRKAGEERSFWTTETNFLPGRTFESLEDMNQQAIEWATQRMYQRPVAKTGLIPAKAFEHEQTFLIKLSPHLPAPYRPHKRGTDQYGYAAFDGNFYWVPGTGRSDVKVLEYGDRVKIYRGRECLIEYALPPTGTTNERISPKGQPKPRYQPKNRKKPAVLEEKKLRAMAEGIGDYLDFALKTKGLQRHRFMRELFRLSRQMTSSLFVQVIERALHYRILRLDTIRNIAQRFISEGTDMFPSPDIDEHFREREAYREGHLTDEPDFSVYDELLEEDDNEEKEEDHG